MYCNGNWEENFALNCLGLAVPQGKKLNWTQRISAAIGVTKGVQFLHTGIVPGVYSNNLKITNVLMDHDLHPKISSYNLPLLVEITATVLIKRTPIVLISVMYNIVPNLRFFDHISLSEQRSLSLRIERKCSRKVITITLHKIPQKLCLI